MPEILFTASVGPTLKDLLKTGLTEEAAQLVNRAAELARDALRSNVPIELRSLRDAIKVRTATGKNLSATVFIADGAHISGRGDKAQVSLRKAARTSKPLPQDKIETIRAKAQEKYEDAKREEQAARAEALEQGRLRKRKRIYRAAHGAVLSFTELAFLLNTGGATRSRQPRHDSSKGFTLSPLRAARRQFLQFGIEEKSREEAIKLLDQRFKKVGGTSFAQGVKARARAENIDESIALKVAENKKVAARALENLQEEEESIRTASKSLNSLANKFKKSSADIAAAEQVIRTKYTGSELSSKLSTLNAIKRRESQEFSTREKELKGRIQASLDAIEGADDIDKHGKLVRQAGLRELAETAKANLQTAPAAKDILKQRAERIKDRLINPLLKGVPDKTVTTRLNQFHRSRDAEGEGEFEPGSITRKGQLTKSWIFHAEQSFSNYATKNKEKMMGNFTGNLEAKFADLNTVAAAFLITNKPGSIKPGLGVF